jgi:hypothetical protein
MLNVERSCCKKQFKSAGHVLLVIQSHSVRKRKNEGRRIAGRSVTGVKNAAN